MGDFLLGFAYFCLILLGIAAVLDICRRPK